MTEGPASYRARRFLDVLIAVVILVGIFDHALRFLSFKTTDTNVLE